MLTHLITLSNTILDCCCLFCYCILCFRSETNTFMSYSSGPLYISLSKTRKGCDGGLQSSSQKKDFSALMLFNSVRSTAFTAQQWNICVKDSLAWAYLYIRETSDYLKPILPAKSKNPFLHSFFFINLDHLIWLIKCVLVSHSSLTCRKRSDLVKSTEGVQEFN